MTEPGDRLRAAVAAGALPAEEEFAALLRSIVVVARSIFGARGSSIFLYDGDTDELVFAAVAAEEDQKLVGTRMSASKGVAGWVLQSGTPLVLGKHPGLTPFQVKTVLSLIANNVGGAG